MWLGHPRGLFVLALTEAWEKFSFFGMRALLVYYMTKQLGFSHPHASLVYGAYAAAVYLTPLAGGIACDRWLGQRKAVLFGGSIMALGHFMMAFDSLLFPALAAIAVGNGLYLPSLPSQVRSLYPRADPRLASAYNVYYAAVNLGAFLAPFVCGTIGELYGWHWGFAAAGVGMLIGLGVYVFGTATRETDARLADTAVQKSAVDADASPAFGRERLALLMSVVAAVVIFRIAYEQVGNTVAVWADQRVDLSIGAQLAIPVTWFQALNPLLVLTLTPLVVIRGTRRTRMGEGAPIRRMVAGAAVVGCAYVLLASVSWLAETRGADVSWPWLVAFFVILTSGELYILPVGLALFGMLAPRRMQATALAIWFLAAFAGNLLAGLFGALWSRWTPAEFFLCTAAIAATSAALLWRLRRTIERHGASHVTHSVTAQEVI